MDMNARYLIIGIIIGLLSEGLLIIALFWFREWKDKRKNK